MALDKPQDLAWMFIIFAAVVVTFGFGLSSINEVQNASQDASFFNTVYGNVTSADGLKGAADAQEGTLVGTEGSGDEATEEGFILQSFNSLRNLGKTYNVVEQTVGTSSRLFGLDPIYWTLITSGLLISFAAVLYTWLRGN